MAKFEAMTPSSLEHERSMNINNTESEFYEETSIELDMYDEVRREEAIHNPKYRFIGNSPMNFCLDHTMILNRELQNAEEA